MILRAQHREVTIELDDRERIILYLAQDLPLPESKYDVKALPRTVARMVEALHITRTVLYALLESMMEELIIAHHPIALKTKTVGGYSNVYVLTPEGNLLAEALRRRAI
ncbi:MAG: hypothetical protein GXX95_01325 [Methanomassiliicoccus sp.]|nr:hypothetical protein [Methanomassiliicoccus sp.]